MDEHLAKPLDLNGLREALRRLLPAPVTEPRERTQSGRPEAAHCAAERGPPGRTCSTSSTALGRVGGDPAILAEITATFLDQWPSSASGSSPRAPGRHRGDGRVAHRLKGGAGAVAAPGMQAWPRAASSAGAPATRTRVGERSPRWIGASSPSGARGRACSGERRRHEPARARRRRQRRSGPAPTDRGASSRCAGHEVDSGYLDAAEALAGLSARPDVDLFVVDLHMPGIDGWKLCRLLRSPEFARFNATPILVVSATFTGDDVASITRELGANALPRGPLRGSQR